MLMKECTRESSDEPMEEVAGTKMKPESNNTPNRSNVKGLKVKFKFKRSRGELGARTSFVQAWAKVGATQATILPKLHNDTNLKPAHRATFKGSESKFTPHHNSQGIITRDSCGSNASL